mgnify:CR=1 FL=1
MKYYVGQVLFLLIQKDKKVLPVQVIEQIVRKTLDGETVSYNVRLPDTKMTTASLDSVDAEVFTSAEDAKAVMVKSAVSAIDKIVNVAVSAANDKFESFERPARVDEDVLRISDEIQMSEISTSDPSESDASVLEDFSNAQIDLGDGVKATVRSIGN